MTTDSPPESRGHTAGAVAHDVNNLLQVILGCCEKLRADAGLSDTHRAELDHITVAAEHATGLASRMLTPAGRAAGERRTLDLRRALERLHGLLDRIVGDDVVFEMDLPPVGTGIRMNEGDLAQVLINLAVNAREAMPGGGRLGITAGVLTVDGANGGDAAPPPGPYVKLDVCDSGSGMSAEVRARAFERFFTTKGQEGSGHGLATVQTIVQQHGGHVAVHSEPGNGTQFTILVPLVASAPAGETAAPPARAGELVLVADDEPMAREVIVSLLQGLGYQTLEAGSARDALATLLDPSRRVGVLVADVTMPDMTGIELARRVRELTAAPEVLLISGDSAESVTADAGPAVAFLQKPFNSIGLGTAVRDLLDRSVRQPSSPAVLATARPIDWTLADRMPAPLFIVQDDRFVYVNQAFASVMALSPGELQGHRSVERVHPDDRQLFPSGSNAVMPDDAGQSASTQVRVRCGDGAERSLVLTTVPLAHEGRPALLGVATDVTLQPDALNVAVRMAALGRLAGGVAHDFNNLLLVMGGHVERLQKKLPPESDLRPEVDAIAAAATRAGTLTDKLLSFGRRQLLAPEVQDLGRIVDGAAAELRSSVGPSIELRVDRAPSLPPIEADRSRLREVLWHLVDNAREAMPSGGTLTLAVDAIEVDAALESRWAFLTRGVPFVRLRVIDTGRGMDPGVAAHAFEPFFTTKGKGRGAGMGLASVYGIVKQSGGYVFADRSGQRGTCMTILLPPAPVRERAAAAPRHHEPPAADAPRARNRILLVEDDPGVREILQDLLTGHGFDVQAAASAEDAQVYAAARVFDLLLSDVDLPGMNGARLAAHLVASQPGLRVILMSGYPDDGTIDGELAERPMFLSKPFRSPVLLEHLRKALSDDDR